MLDYSGTEIEIEKESFVVQLNEAEGVPKLLISGIYEIDPATYAYLQIFSKEELQESFSALVSAMVKIMIHEEETGEEVLNDSIYLHPPVEHPWDQRTDENWGGELEDPDGYWPDTIVYGLKKEVELDFQETEIKID